MSYSTQEISTLQKTIAPSVYGDLDLDIEPERFRTQLGENSIIRKNKRIQALLQDEQKVEFFRQLTLMGDPLAVRGFQYDLACNGYELVSGAIRNHKPEIMFKAFEIAGYGKEEVEKRFGGMVNAFQYGAPPHGGCAAGIDRIVMLLAEEANIREVIMFPMNQRAEDLMMNAPSDPTNEQLRELNLRVVPQEK